MNFKEGLPIYVQIAERLSDEILSGMYEADARVPAVREYSSLLEVNVNTAVKAFDLLRRRGVIVYFYQLIGELRYYFLKHIY